MRSKPDNSAIHDLYKSDGKLDLGSILAAARVQRLCGQSNSGVVDGAVWIFKLTA